MSGKAKKHTGRAAIYEVEHTTDEGNNSFSTEQEKSPQLFNSRILSETGLFTDNPKQSTQQTPTPETSPTSILDQIKKTVTSGPEPLEPVTDLLLNQKQWTKCMEADRLEKARQQQPDSAETDKSYSRINEGSVDNIRFAVCLWHVTYQMRKSATYESERSIRAGAGTSRPDYTIGNAPQHPSRFDTNLLQSARVSRVTNNNHRTHNRNNNNNNIVRRVGYIVRSWFRRSTAVPERQRIVIIPVDEKIWKQCREEDRIIEQRQQEEADRAAREALREQMRMVNNSIRAHPEFVGFEDREEYEALLGDS